MALRLAFAGFRHYHILDLYEYAKNSNRIDVIASAEDDTSTVEDLKGKNVEFTHNSVEQLMESAADFDAVAIGDYYVRRGSLAIAALTAGKHVILDKPMCTSLRELERIESISRDKDLVVGCMLNNRDTGQFRALKRLINENTIGEIQAVNFMGHHPLNYGTRPSWYFEEGKHGGTINDIAIHAVDLIPWLTGREITRIVAARVWNSRLLKCPDFQVGAQLMLALEGGAGVIGDVSYLSPDSQGYTVPQYWRYTIHGSEGILETGINLPGVTVWQNGKTDSFMVPADPEREGGVFEDFLNEIEGTPELCDLTTAQAINSARVCLEIQEHADKAARP